MTMSRRKYRLLTFLVGVTMETVSCSQGPSSSNHGGSDAAPPTAGNVGTATTSQTGGSGGRGGAGGGLGGTSGSTGGTSAGAGGRQGFFGGASSATGGTSGNTGGASAGASNNTGGTGGKSPDAGISDGPGSDRPLDVASDSSTRDTVRTAEVAGPDGSQPCVSGQCTCPSGQFLCGSDCIDTSTSTSHCGGCNRPCAAGQSCGGGVCGGASSTGDDGCTSDLALNLTLQQIAVYQSVKIPVMTGGAEVAAASRNASVVQGRDTMFRLFVTLGSGWTTRDLSARLTVTSAGGQPTQYYSKKTISASSVDSDLKTTFQIFLPPSAMTDPLRYSAEVVECSAQSGTAGQAQFPASGDIDLGVETTGGLKIKIIPMQVGNLLPDTSATTLAGYAAEMTAMYPITDIFITVGDTLTTTTPLDWSGMLDQVRAKRASDKPAADVYYFGLIKPAATLRAYCQSTCTTGIGFVVTSATGATAGASRDAVGVGFADKPSFDTMAHEVGHNHGRNHAPCSTAGTITGVDPNYPYANGALGSWGYDARTQTLFDPTKSTDIMGYCANQWVSDYTYSGIATRVGAVDSAAMAMVYTVPGALSRWRVLLVDDRGPHWGIPITDEVPAEGDPELATIYDRTGAVLTTVTVYRTDIGDISARMLMVPEPRSNWYAVAVAGAQALPFVASQP